eukprot:1101901-Amphidinium_carterae.1
MAVWVPLKGAEEYAVKSIRIFVQSLGIPRLEYTSDTIELQRFEWDGRKTALGIARHVSHDQVMPRRTVQNEDTDTSSVSTMA